MKTIYNNPDEFDQLITEFSNLSPSVKFREDLNKKIQDQFESPVWLLTIKDFFGHRMLVGSLGSLAILVIGFSFLYNKPITVPSIKPSTIGKHSPTFATQRDDWIYKYTGEEERSIPIAGGGFSLPQMFQKSAPMGMQSQSVSESYRAADSNLGYSTGGAKDINNFRENIKNGYLPLPTDITYEGLFYDYFFDTGKQMTCTELFCPSYSYAVSRDPFSKQNEYYMTVGLNSGIKESDFHRKNLNLIVVLDISGSMGSAFDEYYYDKNHQPESENKEDRSKKKMQVANEAIVAMLGNLQPQDRFGMVLFDGSAYEAKPLNYVGETNMNAIKDHILKIQEQGSTNHEAGYKKGMEVFKNARLRNDNEYENRIIFLTDAMPNTGSTDRDSLLSLVAQAASDKVYTSFVGVGIDFNSELIEHITKVSGANYYSVHSSYEFRNRMDTEFEYMVTPLVFDLSLDFQSQGWEIEKVYGSPDTDVSQGNLMYVRTLFPSASAGGETKGGVVLLKLRKKGEDNQSIRLTASYTDRSGRLFKTNQTVSLPLIQTEYYPQTGIRKAIVLTRYANVMKNFILSKRLPKVYIDRYESMPKEGIMIPDETQSSEWERTSQSLSLTEEDRSIFTQFSSYFQREQQVLNDSTLIQESEILRILSR